MIDKADVIGSEARDIFRFWHKKLRDNFPDAKQFYGLDIDFVLVHKDSYETGGITAVFDYKKVGSERIEFTEALMYKFFLDAGVRVFLFISNVDMERKIVTAPVSVREVLSIDDWKKEEYTLGVPIEFETTKEFVTWESDLRVESFLEVPR